VTLWRSLTEPDEARYGAFEYWVHDDSLPANSCALAIERCESDNEIALVINRFADVKVGKR